MPEKPAEPVVRVVPQRFEERPEEPGVGLLLREREDEVLEAVGEERDLVRRFRVADVEVVEKSSSVIKYVVFAYSPCSGQKIVSYSVP